MKKLLAIASISTIALAGCQSTIQADLAKLTSFNQTAVQDAKVAGASVASANLALINWACANYSGPHLIFVALASAPGQRLIPDADVAIEGKVSSVLAAGCSGAPYVNYSQALGNALAAWATFVQVTNKNKVPVQAAPSI